MSSALNAELICVSRIARHRSFLATIRMHKDCTTSVHQDCGRCVRQ